jgi:hypothetical protein
MLSYSIVVSPLSFNFLCLLLLYCIYLCGWHWLTWVVLPVGWEGIVLGALLLLLLLLHGLGHHGRHARLLPPVHLGHVQKFTSRPRRRSLLNSFTLEIEREL